MECILILTQIRLALVFFVIHKDTVSYTHLTLPTN